jgi:hypothetical protein
MDKSSNVIAMAISDVSSLQGLSGASKCFDYRMACSAGRGIAPVSTRDFIKLHVDTDLFLCSNDIVYLHSKEVIANLVLENALDFPR